MLWVAQIRKRKKALCSLIAGIVFSILIFTGCCSPITLDKTTTSKTVIDRVNVDTLNVSLPAVVKYQQDTLVQNDTIRFVKYLTAYKDTVLTVYRNNKVYRDSLKVYFNEMKKQFDIIYKQPPDTLYKTIESTNTTIEKPKPWYENQFFTLLAIVGLIVGVVLVMYKVWRK